MAMLHHDQKKAEAMTDPIQVGTRTICDMQLLPAATNHKLEVEPGDIIVCKTRKNPLSRLIGKLDGWWCHTAIATSSTNVVHASSAGITCASIADLRDSYEAGLGIARPKRTQEQRAAAAEWALDLADKKIAYGANDLGTAFSLLWRASLQPSSSELYDQVAGKRVLAADEADWRKKYETTCSGFAYRAYAEGATSLLKICPAPGIRLEDGKLIVPDREALLKEAERALEAESDSDKKVLSDEVRLARIGIAGSVQAAKALFLNEPVPLEVGVTPADIWTSPDHDHRWLITGNNDAAEAAKDC